MPEFERRVWTDEERRQNLDLHERVAVLESDQEERDAIIREMRAQLRDMIDVQAQISGAIKFVKVIAWISGIGMTAWGLILAQVGSHSAIAK